jgi:hypothetical protein
MFLQLVANGLVTGAVVATPSRARTTSTRTRRFYTLGLDIADGVLTNGDVHFTGVTTLLAPDGKPYAPVSLDPSRRGGSTGSGRSSPTRSCRRRCRRRRCPSTGSSSCCR